MNAEKSHMSACICLLLQPFFSFLLTGPILNMYTDQAAESSYQ